MPDNQEELDKILYGTGLPATEEKYGITVEDIEPPITDDAWADPLRTEGASTDPNFNMNYGDLDEKIDKVYETKASHPNFRDIQRFINKQTDENERFSHEVVFNPKSYPVHEGIRKPTKLEWTQMDEKDRTKTRRNWFMDNKAAVEKVSSSMGEFIKKGFQKTIKLLSQESVGDYKKLLKTPEPTIDTEEFSMIQPQEESLAATISKVEGTDKKAKDHGYSSGYDVTLGYGKYDPEWFNSKEKSLSDLTVSEVIELQSAILGHPDNDLNSSAVGKWQLTRRTLKDLMDRKVVDVAETEKFTPAVQDKIFYALLEKRGYSKFKQGKLTKEDFLKGLKNEWEGLDRFRSDITSHLEGIEGRA